MLFCVGRELAGLLLLPKAKYTVDFNRCRPLTPYNNYYFCVSLKVSSACLAADLQDLVIQRVDNGIHWINDYPVQIIVNKTSYTFQQIVIYPRCSVIEPHKLHIA